MPKTLPADVIAQLAGASIRPRYLLTIVTASGVTYRYCTGYSDINFPSSGGSTFTARGFSFNSIRSDLTLQVDRVQVGIDNIDGVVLDYFADIQGATVTIALVDLGKLASASNDLVKFSGIAGAPSANSSSVSFPVLSPFSKLAAKYPTGQLSAPCPRRFDSDDCRKSELIADPWFEDAAGEDFTSWTEQDTGGDVTFAATSNPVFDEGNIDHHNALLIAYGDTPAHWYDAYIGQNVSGSLVVGKQYEFRVWAKASKSCTARARLSRLDSSHIQSNLDATVGTSWIELSGTFTCDDATTQFAWFSADGLGVGDYIYFTGAYLRRVLAETDTGTVEAGSTAVQIVDAAHRTEDAGHWDCGLVTITSGALSGEQRQVSTSDTGEVNLIPPLPDNPAAGVTYTIARGCDKQAKTCWVDHDNWINYGGFKMLPRES